VLDGVIARTSTVQKGQDMVREGNRPSESKLLLEGFAGRYKFLRDGKRRITVIHVTGDFVDLHSFVLKRMDHSIVALSPCTVAHVPHEAIRQTTERHPHLTRLLWLHTALDGAMHQQWLAASRESALCETAHLVCELFVRLRSIGQTDGCSFPLPLTQIELGDVLGLSTWHVNRTIQELRGDGLLTWNRDHVVIEDWDRLCAVAQFDPAFLVLESEPR
jgi:CRP-like cAMP-binding protein